MISKLKLGTKQGMHKCEKKALGQGAKSVSVQTDANTIDQRLKPST